MTGRTDLDELGSTRKGALELASAKLVNAVGGLMERAMCAAGKQNQEIASAMLVTPARITQLLAADGNIKVSTLARFMDACGYEVEISARPKGSDLPSLEPRRRQSRRKKNTLPEAAPSRRDLRADVDYYVDAVNFHEFVTMPTPIVGGALFSLSSSEMIRARWVALGKCGFESAKHDAPRELYGDEVAQG